MTIKITKANNISWGMCPYIQGWHPLQTVKILLHHWVAGYRRNQFMRMNEWMNIEETNLWEAIPSCSQHTLN